jgi:uncharacterized protein YxjI
MFFGCGSDENSILTPKNNINQKIWALGDDFAIKDETGKDVYLVDGKGFSLGDKLSFQDMNGNELAYISEKVFSFQETYEIHRNGELFAKVVKDFSWFKDKFTVDLPGPNDYEVTGDFWYHEYKFARKGREVASVSKEYFSWSDTYGINIVEGEDDITILATAVVIDLINQSERRQTQ